MKLEILFVIRYWSFWCDSFSFVPLCVLCYSEVSEQVRIDDFEPESDFSFHFKLCSWKSSCTNITL